MKFTKHFTKPGTAPGTLEPRAERRVEAATIDFIDYSSDHLEEKRIARMEELLPLCETDTVTWINIVGGHDVQVLEQLGSGFGLHRLALEDVLHTGQRPKVEDYEDHNFIVLKLISLEDRLQAEQISIFQGKNFVITIQEVPGDVFDPIRERIRQGKGKIRDRGADYLTYALVDALVDHFFPVLEEYGERIEELEDELTDTPTRESLEKIHVIRKDLLMMRRAAWPQREVVSALERQESPLIDRGTKIFLRDAYDHAVQILDIIESYRDLASGLMDLYLSSVSNRTNDVMKVLTIMASIFIPLSFVAGIYGMNFNPEAGPWSMPELDWPWAYPALWLIMIGIAGGMVLFFRRRGWW